MFYGPPERVQERLMIAFSLFQGRVVYGPPERAQERLIIAECNLTVRDKRLLHERKINVGMLHKVCLQYASVRV